MEVIILGLVTAANIIFILFKYEKARYADATMDLFLLVVVGIVFGGSYAGLVVGTIASLVISVYLYIKPPKLTSFSHNPELVSDFKERFGRRC
jgi:hypothetical protein